MSERYQIKYDEDRFSIVVDTHDNDRTVFEDASLVACKLRVARLNRLHLLEQSILGQLAREFKMSEDEALVTIVREAVAFASGSPTAPRSAQVEQE